MSSSKSVLTVFCCLLLGATASAQITITQGDIPNAIGDTFVTKVCLDSAFVSLGAPGGPHAWTFDTAAFTGMVLVSELVDKDSTPMGARFPDANMCLQAVRGQHGQWTYRKLEATQLLDLGNVYSRADTYRVHVFSPTGISPLPITYGTQWQTTFGYTDTTSDTTRTDDFSTIQCTMDAWGTVTCPVGTYPCLRENVLETDISTSYLRGAVTTVDTVLTRRFFWDSPGIGTVVLARSMPDDTNSNFTTADDYTVLVSCNSGAVIEQRGLPLASAARILPNPCYGSAGLRLAPGITGPVTVRVCDAAGRVVLQSKTQNPKSKIALDLRGNPAGLYICTVTIGNRTITGGFVLLN